MKPFNLEAAKAGKPIQTRGGKKVTYVTHAPDAHTAYRVVVLREAGDKPVFYSEDGVWYEDRAESIFDLFMATEKKTVYVNVYDKIPEHSNACNLAGAFSTEAEARENASCNLRRVLATAYPVEIEV